MIQENIFSQIDKGFCFDGDINKIVEMLDAIFRGKEMITRIDKEWRVWSHVPQYGYRLSYHVYFDKPLPDSVMAELDKVKKYGLDRGIEVDPFGYHFFEIFSSGDMSIYSTFKDKRKRLR